MTPSRDHRTVGGHSLPSAAVLAAFGLHGEPRGLRGGRGTAVRVGDVVLKPADVDADAVAWIATTTASLIERGFRVARPIPTTQGTWSFEGWTASRYVAGDEPDHHRAPRWDEILAAGDAFHRALAHRTRPAFLDRRTDPWQIGDRVAWQEHETAIVRGLVEPYRQLVALLRPLRPVRRQLIHGDLTGNVLLAPGLPPAIIDFSPYWRPPAFGAAIVVGDAVIWHNAGADLLEHSAELRGRDFSQFVVRALIYRLVTTSEFARRYRLDDAAPDEIDNHRRAASVVTECAS